MIIKTHSEIAFMASPNMDDSRNNPINSPVPIAANWSARSANARFMFRLPFMTLALPFTTFCARANTPITISNVCVRIYTAQKVLKIHLYMLKTSNSAILFFSITM
jgi:hypothetical protein